MVVNNYFVAASPISWEGSTLKFSSMFVQHMQEVENMPIPPVYVYIYIRIINIELDPSSTETWSEKNPFIWQHILPKLFAAAH